MKLMNISEEGLKLIKSFEGCRLIAYDDLQPKVALNETTKIAGTLTIGWGHTRNVKVGQRITQEEADNLLMDDLKWYIAYTNNPSYVPLINELNQNQFDSLVSFCYNCGAGNLRNLCTGRTLKEISTKMLEYNKSKGTVLAGLVRRREAEKQLFDKVEYAMDEEYAKRIIKLETKINKLEENETKIIIALAQLNDRLEEIQVPDWFVKEFPNGTDLLHQKTGTLDFWRGFAVSLRLIQKI